MTIAQKISESDSLLCICIFASFSDGEKCGGEREQLAGLASELESGNLASLSRAILMGKTSLADAISGLEDRKDKMLAYEMARAVCEADGTTTPDETKFLEELSHRLGLSKDEAVVLDNEVDELALAPVVDQSPPPPVQENKGMILRYSILNGALELLPQTLATVAIVPLQMKMVYRIGKSHGAELDRRSIVEFLATAGVGMGSQVVEGFARKLMNGLGKKALGKTAGKAAGVATGSAFSFASTYGIGHLADKYYSGGRSLGANDRKTLLASFSEEGKLLHARHLPEIEARSRSLDPASVLSLVRGKQLP